MARMDTKLKTVALVLLLVSVVTIMVAATRTITHKPLNGKDYQDWLDVYVEGFGCNYKFEGQELTNITKVLCCGNSITITVYYVGGEPKLFDWSSTYPISAVIVKNGVDGAFLYEYDPPQTSDTGLYAPPAAAPKGISHIVFCWNCPTVYPEFPLAPEVIAALGLVAWTAVRRRRKL